MVHNKRCNKTFTSNKQMAVVQRLHWSVVKKTEKMEHIWEIDCYVCMYVCMVCMYDCSQNNGYTDSVQTCFKGESKSVLLRHLNLGCLLRFSNSRSKDQRMPSLAHALLPRETQ